MSAYVSIPGFTGLKDITKSFANSVKPVDVLVGALAGMVVGPLFASFVAKRATADNIWGKLGAYASPLGSIATGAVLFAAQKGKGRAAGHFVGAVGGGVVPLVATKVGNAAAGALKMEGYVMAPMGMILPDSAYGMILPDAAYGAATESSREYQMRDLQAYSMANGEVEEYMA